MRHVIVVLAIAFASPPTTRAFHHHGQFQEAADGRAAVPGSGGLYYTGSRRDLGLRCTHCHVEAPGRIRADVSFTPDASTGWTPGTTYRVTVTMTGESAGLSGCGMIPNRNGITATIVGPGGSPVGELSPDADGRRCGNRFPPVGGSQTTVVFGDCEGVVGVQDGTRSLDTWRFDWRAPSAGAGDATLWLGVVDGSCDFTSYDDDVYETRIDVPEASSAALLPAKHPRDLRLARGERHALPPRRRRV